MSEICIDGHFLEDCFYCPSQKIISAVANESLIPYNLIKRAPETQNLLYCNIECHPKPNKKNIKYSSAFRAKDLFHRNRNNKITCKIVCKMQFLKNGLQFNVSESSVSSINPIYTNVY